MKRFQTYLWLVLRLMALLFAVWGLSRLLLPQAVLRPYFSRLFDARVAQFSFTRVLLANLLPFFGVQFMNLFHVTGRPGGLYVLPLFWIIYGLLLGTNSFVYAGQPVPFSPAVLWTRTGFTELLAYTTAYEATKGWTLWEQDGLWSARPVAGATWRPHADDWLYWVAALLLLVWAVAREVA